VQLYSGTPRRLKPWATAIPDTESLSFERPLFENLAPQMREFRLYLPLYCPLDKVEIGLDAGAKILAPTAPDVAKPVVFYGTSITQGGCASATGHDFVSMVGRLINVETINLGFSGNGLGEKEVARFISEIDASLFVLDYAANVYSAELRRTLPHFVDILRAERPDVPILLMSNVYFAAAAYTEQSRRDEMENRRDVAMEFYVSRRKRGDRNIHFADGFGLLPYGVDGAFVDGIHPTDHGFALMAQRLVPIIEQILLQE
jgi:lysophospholipase L1-like esterase